MLPPNTMHLEPLIAAVIQMLEREYREREELTFHERRELEALDGELRLLQAFLKESSMIDETSKVFRERKRQIRELAYELEDTVEKCLVRKTASTWKMKNTVIIGCLIRKLDYSMAREVRSIREKKVKRIVDMVEKDLARVESIGPTSEKPFIEVRLDKSSSSGIMGQCWCPQEEDKMVAIEDEATLLTRILQPMTRLDVISITGMPGIGKTAVVEKLYHDEAICNRFPLRIWIHVSQKFDSRDTFARIVESLIPKGGAKPSDQQLIPCIRKHLADKRFLLVIDDIWSVEDWETIQNMLPKENEMGRVVVTTRRREVAVHANIFREPYEHGLLGREKSLELLKLHLYGDLRSCPPELEDLAQAVADKCAGLPLSIMVIGGVLKNQFTGTRSILGLQEGWSKVAENFDQFLMEDDNNSIWKSFRLSYDDLPNAHRTCLLYAGLYPEEHEIRASTLTRLWIDEGFVPRKGRKCKEAAAERILDDLVNRNLIMVTTKILDRVKTCRVHRIIREFCRAKAAEENFFQVLKENSQGVMDKPTPDARRLCLHSDPSKLKMSVVEPTVPRVRSVLCFLDEPIDVDPEHISAIISSFDVLRIFNCKSINLRQIPDFSRLLLLKHITLCVGTVDIIPAHVAKLPKLRTFVMNTDRDSVIRVKANMWKMVEIRCFKTNAVFVLNDKRWRGKGCSSLETISNVSPQSCTQILGRKACNLKKLGIKGDVTNLFNNLSLESDFPLLIKLKVLNDSSSGARVTLPRQYSFPVNLESLTLSNTRLGWKENMPALASIKSLKTLKLKDHAFSGVVWVAEDGGFEKLQYLHMENVELFSWRATAAYFPRLRRLVIKKSKALSEIPTSLGKNLDVLEVEEVSESLTNSAREIEAIKRNQQRPISGVPFKLTIN